MQKIIVSGIGFATCIGIDQQTVINNLRAMNHGIDIFPPFDSPDIPIKLAGTIDEFNTYSEDQEDWTYPKNMRLRLDILRGLPPHGLYSIYALNQAIEDAGLTPNEISNPQTGLFTASSGSISRTYYNLNRMKKIGAQRCSPLGIVSSIAGTLNFNLVALHKIKGASTGFVSACASSGHALGYAFEEIQSGRQERMIVVGAEDISPENILPFVSMRVLSPSTNPGEASKPFDQKRNGFVGTGGSTAIILESEDAFLKRNAPKAYSEFKSWGQATDGHHVAISHPQGDGLQRAMKNCLKNGNLKKTDLDYINAHATSTPVGDASEIIALKSVFNPEDAQPAISSTKALTGHGLSLSSIMEFAFTSLSIKNNFMPGSAHIQELDENAKDLNIIQETIEKPVQTAMSNSSGFGGANVCTLQSSL